jgi:hypothetical protein
VANHGNLHAADVVAVFDSQMGADEALLQLRMAGFDDSRIGYFVWHPNRGLTNMLDRNFAFVGAAVGGAIGIALSVGVSQLLNGWSLWARDFGEPFGLRIACGAVLALFCGLIGWGIGLGVPRASVEAPAVNPGVGPFIIAVSAGDARDRAWSLVRHAGGHELPPGALMARPVAV